MRTSVFGVVVASLIITGCERAPQSPRSSSERSTPSTRSSDGGQSSKPAPAIPAYSIISDKKTATLKRSVDVRLSKPVSESELRAIANDIHDRDPGYDRTFILYWLPGMEVGAGAWASSHFNPNLEIVMFGATAEEQAKLESAISDDSAVGTWRDRSPHGGAISIRPQGEVFVFIQRFTDGSELRRDVRESRKGGQRRFDPIESVTGGEYYVIAKDGYLEIYDDEGLLSRAEPAG